VQTLGQGGDTDQCDKIWQQMLEEDSKPPAAAFMALLESHLKQGQVEGAILAYESLRVNLRSGKYRGVTQALVEECRVAFIRSLCRVNHANEATHIYQQAKVEGSLSSIDCATCLMLAKVQAESGSLSHAWATIEDMGTIGHKPNESLIHSFLSTCLKQSQGQYAKAVFKTVTAHGMFLSQATYALLIKLHGGIGEVEEALEVYKFMTCKQCIEPTAETQVSMIRVCFQCCWPDKAFELLAQARFHSSGKSAVDGRIYRACICGAASADLVNKGIQLVEEALREGVALPTDAIEFLGSAASKRGPWGPHAAAKLRQIAATYGYSV